MDRLKSLYRSFSKSEARGFKNYLEAFHTKGKNKPLELIKLIEKQPDISLHDAAEKLYKDPKSKGFIMMKSRLFEKMTEFVTLSVNPSGPKPDKNSPFSFDLIEYRKQMLFGAIFRSRRLNTLAEDCLRKAAEIARECDCPELEIDALLRLRAIRTSKADEEELDEITTGIREAIPRQNVDINGVVSYQRFLERHTMNLSDDASKIRFLEEHIPRLQSGLQESYSVRADYYLQTLKINYFSITGAYPDCKNTILYVVDLVSKHRGLKNPQRMATPYLQLGLLEMKFHNYLAAIEALDTCKSYLRPRTMGYFRASLIKLYGFIFLRDMERMDELLVELRKLLKAPAIKNSTRSVGMFTYLTACCQYLKGNHLKAWQILQEITEFNFDKGGWATGIRIFEIMLLVEQSEPDMASQKLENLRKHLSRYDADARSRSIFKLLSALEKSHWNFENVKKEAELLEELHSGEGADWVHLGSEAIRFDDWYRGKMS